jgi:hypothetical protein
MRALAKREVQDPSNMQADAAELRFTDATPLEQDRRQYDPGAQHSARAQKLTI